MSKQRPILFSGAMVKAILSGAKTQTRRIIKLRNWAGDMAECDDGSMWPWSEPADAPGTDYWYRCPFGAPGDRLWVRETFSLHPQYGELVFRADGEEPVDGDGWIWHPRWRPSIHMPRYLSRITLHVTGVRVERLQDITTEDCIAEGISTRLREHDAECHLREQFNDLWDSLNASRGFGWDANPWVWVVEFEWVEL